MVHIKMAFASKYTQKFIIEQSDPLKDCEIEFKSSILKDVFTFKNAFDGCTSTKPIFWRAFKGQFISKGLVDILNSSKKMNEKKKTHRTHST